MPGPLVHAVAGRDERLLVFVHEAGPALEHQDDVEVGSVAVPAGALFRCHVGLDELGEDPAAGRLLDAEVLVEEEVAQPVAAPRRVFGLDVGKAFFSRVAVDMGGSLRPVAMPARHA